MLGIVINIFDILFFLFPTLIKIVVALSVQRVNARAQYFVVVDDDESFCSAMQQPFLLPWLLKLQFLLQ